jgi:VWFA-related protein
MPSSVQTTASVATSFSVQPIAPKNTGPIVATNAPQNTVPTIQVNVNRVLVPVVVRDRQGRVVGDLKQQDFEVFDNNKPRAISAFTIEKRGSAEVSAVSGAAGGAGPPAAPSAMPPQPAPPRFIVFLFDDRHLTLQDLAYAQKAAVKGLDGALAGPSDRAIVLSTTGSVNSSLTADRTKLQEAIMAVKPQGISRPTTTGCPKIDYYQADQIVNKNDDAAFMDAVRQYLGCQPGTPSPCGISMQEQSGISTPQDLQVRCLKMSQPGVDVMTISTNFLLQILHPVLDTYAFIGGVVSKLAALPGERTLILISSGFPNNDPQAQAMESRLIDFAAQSNVTIDALDARGMYTTVLSAGEELAGANLVLRDQFRSAAESQDDAPMANLADGTGGTFFHHDNDLDAGFKKLTEAPEIVYLLELSLDGVKADGTFHRLKVKVRRDDVDVKARSEFFMPRPAKGK